MGLHHTETLDDLQRWHQGEEGALNKLLKRNLSWIRARVRKRLGPELRQRVESSDIVQDAMAQFLQYGPRFLISDENHFRALVARIVENVLCDNYDWFTARRRAIAKAHPLPGDSVLDLDCRAGKGRTPSTSAQHHEEEGWIRLGMELLQPRDREIIVLHQWECLSFSEIGKRLGISVNSAWKRHKRAVYRLGEKVGALRRGNMSCLEE